MKKVKPRIEDELRSDEDVFVNLKNIYSVEKVLLLSRSSHSFIYIVYLSVYIVFYLSICIYLCIYQSLLEEKKKKKKSPYLSIYLSIIDRSTYLSRLQFRLRH